MKILTAALALLLALPALADRAVDGTYSLPNNGTSIRNPVTAGQVITKDLWNGTFNDVRDNITDSLSRRGEGAMLSALKLVDGASTALDLVWDGAATTGFYLNAATVGLKVGGATGWTCSASACEFTPALALTGGISSNITKTTGTLTITSPSGVWLDTSTAGQAVRLRTNGGTRFSAFDTYLDATSLPIRSVADPTNAQDAATKAYVDSLEVVLYCSIPALGTSGTCRLPPNCTAPTFTHTAATGIYVITSSDADCWVQNTANGVGLVSPRSSISQHAVIEHTAASTWEVRVFDADGVAADPAQGLYLQIMGK